MRGFVVRLRETGIVREDLDMVSKYARKNYYEVVTWPGKRVVSQHYKLSVARKAVKGTTHRVRNQDGRYYL